MDQAHNAGPSWLPAILAEIAAVAGVEAALKLAEQYGGTRRVIPARLSPDHWLIQCVGREAALAIVERFVTRPPDGRPYGVEIVIPLGPTGSAAAVRRRLQQALDAGMTARDAALAAGVHERTVYRARRKMRQDGDDPQGSLF